jgi:hypothetical protein
MNFETKPNDVDNPDAIVPSVAAVDINCIYNGHVAVIDRICSNVIVIPTVINLSVRILEVVDNKVIDWDRLVDVYSVVHTNIDNTSDDDHYHNDYVDYFQDDPNPLIHTSDYDAAREGNNYDDLNNHNHNDLDSEHDTDISDSLF